jgi:hypothetical protein
LKYSLKLFAAAGLKSLSDDFLMAETDSQNAHFLEKFHYLGQLFQDLPP